MNNNVLFNNPIKAQIIRKNGDVVDIPMVSNGVVNDGFIYLLGSSFRAEPQISSWYIGLIQGEGASIPILDPSDTTSSHAWTENVDYDEPVRPTWSPTAFSATSIANTTTRDFTFNAITQVRGIFIPSSDAKGGASGTLWATALFNANMDFTNSDVLRIIYTVSAS